DMIVLRDQDGFAEQMLAVSVHLAPILAFFDGRKTLVEIASQLKTPDGSEIDPERLIDIVKMLSDNHLLENELFFERRAEVLKQYKDAPIRRMTMVGGGFPDSPADFSEYIKTMLNVPESDKFAREIPTETGKIRGLMLPHIDFHRGYETYGRGYSALKKAVAEVQDKNLLIGIIGVAHSGASAPYVATDKNFETPLGTVETDKHAIHVLRQHLGDTPFYDEWVHKNEHSVEIQVVALAEIFKECNFTVLPLLAGNLDLAVNGNGTPKNNDVVEKFIDTLQRVEDSHDGPVLWIASVDFAHIGPRFGDSQSVNESTCHRIKEADFKSLESVRSVNAESWWLSLMGNDNNPRRVCGLSATYLVLRLMQKSRGYIIDYDQAVDPSGDQMVTFASAVFTSR
ncbi:AmmeMemoRadiSam system protein B, partial [bacterium]|nr:AmmeMemoRadiSam system protein B [bacterium]